MTNIFMFTNEAGSFSMRANGKTLVAHISKTENEVIRNHEQAKTTVHGAAELIIEELDNFLNAISGETRFICHGEKPEYAEIFPVMLDDLCMFFGQPLPKEVYSGLEVEEYFDQHIQPCLVSEETSHTLSPDTLKYIRKELELKLKDTNEVLEDSKDLPEPKDMVSAILHFKAKQIAEEMKRRKPFLEELIKHFS